MHKNESESCLVLERSHFTEGGWREWGGVWGGPLRQETPATAVREVEMQRGIAWKSKGHKAPKDGVRILA